MDYKIVKESFFKSYKSFIDVIMLTNINNKLYNILVLRKAIDKNLTNVSIIIRSSNNNNEDAYHEQISNMILSNEEACNLIDDIRNDFKENHYIAYSSLNYYTKIQTLQNTKFSLNIKILNEEEFEDAIAFNNKINCKSNRHKVLSI